MAVLMAVIVLGTFFVMVDNIKSNYKEMFVENQLKKISSELSASITSSSSMNGMSHITKIKIPIVYYENRKYAPSIVIEDGSISASVVLAGKTISYSSSFAAPPEQVVLFDEENRYLVIKNE